MKAITAITRWVICCIVVQVLSGCTIIPAPEGSESSNFSRWRLVNTMELITLQSLLKYVQELPALTQEVRITQYESLNDQLKPDQQLSVSQRVQLALLQAGVEPSLTDYQQARQQLALARQQATAANEPLLADFISQQTQAVALNEALGIAEQRVQELDKQYRRQLAINRRQRANAAAAEDEKDDYLNLVVMPPVALADLEWQLQVQQKLTTELESVQEQLEQREALIDEQNKMIAVLEAKIKALSAIERNINQRTQNE